MPDMQEIRMTTLVRAISETVKRGKKVAVTGWKDNVHTKATRNIMKSGKVCFYWDPPRNFGPTFGLVLTNPLADGGWKERVGKTSHVHPNTHTNSEIKMALEECYKLIVPPKEKQQEQKPEPVVHIHVPPAPSVPAPGPEPVIDVVAETPIEPEPETQPLIEATDRIELVVVETEPVIVIDEPEADEEVSDSEQSAPLEEEVTENMAPGGSDAASAHHAEPNWQKFAEMFVEKSREHSDNHVSKVVVGEIRRVCGLEKKTNGNVVDAGWIEAVEGGLKAGFYRATPQLLKLAGVKDDTPKAKEPTAVDAIARARKLITDGPALEEERVAIADQMAQLENRRDEIDELLKQRVRALELVEQLEQMFK